MFKKTALFNIIIISIFVIAFLLRLIGLTKYPASINQDELSNIYDGYSIATTGHDRWGENHPFILRAFGEFDYRPPLNAWLCAGSIKILGFSVWAGRLPSAIIGCFSLVLLFLVARKIGGKLLAMFALLFASFSPWHILFSRMAHEGTILPPFFLILSLYLWLKVKESDYKPLFLILFGLTIGLATNAYQSTKLMFFMISGLVFIDLISYPKNKIKAVFITISMIVIGALPQIITAISSPNHFFKRATNGTIIDFHLSFQFLFDFLGKILVNISPNYLFFNSGNFNNLSVARQLPIESIFFYTGLIFCFLLINKNRFFKPIYLYILLIIAILPSALTTDNPHAIRASGLIVLVPIFSAAGLMYFVEMLKSENFKLNVSVFLMFLIVGNGLYFTYKYLKNKDLQNAGQQHDMFVLSEKLNEILKNNLWERKSGSWKIGDAATVHSSKTSKSLPSENRLVYIENFGNMFPIYVMENCEILPENFQKLPKKYIDNGFGGDKFIQIGKYHFVDSVSQIANISDKSLPFLVLSKHKPRNLFLIDSLYLQGNSYYFSTN